MKRFIMICVSAGLFCISVAIFSSVIIDPYNVFHVENIRDNGVEPNKNYIKVNYLIKNADKFDSLIVGSSHVGALHVENISDEKCYNMTCPESLPCEQLENLKSLIQNGYKPKKIYLGVDTWSYRGDPELHKTDKRTISYESLQNKYNLLRNYIDPHNSLFSIVTSVSHTKNPDFQSDFYNYGWMIDYDMRSNYDWSTIGEYESGVTNRLHETLMEIRDYIDVCKANNIECVVFVNPYCAEEFRKDVDGYDYFIFLEKLASIHPYYNFAGINEFSKDHDLFIDPTHYNAYLGDEILDVITGMKAADEGSGWGMYVTVDNVENVIKVLNNELEKEK